jgi:20S proteasome alpha/beta subunit
MTIGIGIRCKDGVVLASDTEMTLPYWFKYSESKIRFVRDISNPVFFSFATNDASFCSMYLERLIAQLRLDNAKSEAMQHSINTAAKAFHTEYRKFYPNMSDGELFPQVLIVKQGDTAASLWSLSGGLNMHQASLTACIGGGASFAKPLLNRLYKQAMSIKEAAYIACYVLSETKRNGYGCGQESQVVLIRPKNTRDPESVMELDSMYADTLDALFPLLTSSWPDPKFDERLGVLTTLLRNNLEKRMSAHVGIYEQQMIDEYLADRPEENYDDEYMPSTSSEDAPES